MAATAILNISLTYLLGPERGPKTKKKQANDLSVI